MKNLNISVINIPVGGEKEFSLYIDAENSLIEKHLEIHITHSESLARMHTSKLITEDLISLKKRSTKELINFLFTNLAPTLLFPTNELFAKLETIGFTKEQFQWFVPYSELKIVLNDLRYPNKNNNFFNLINPTAIILLIELHLIYKLLQSLTIKYVKTSSIKGNQKTEYSYLSNFILSTKRITPYQQRKTIPKSSKSKIKMDDRMFYDNAKLYLETTSTGSNIDFDLLELSQGRTEKIFLANILDETGTALISNNATIRKISKAEFIMRLVPLFSLVCPNLLLSKTEYENKFNNPQNPGYSTLNRQPYDTYEKYIFNTLLVKLTSYKK